MTELNPQDWYGLVIGLQFAITELRNGTTVDICQEHGRLVCMALRGLEHQASELVEAMKAAMKEPKQ